MRLYLGALRPHQNPARSFGQPFLRAPAKSPVTILRKSRSRLKNLAAATRKAASRGRIPRVTRAVDEVGQAGGGLAYLPRSLARSLSSGIPLNGTQSPGRATFSTGVRRMPVDGVTVLWDRITTAVWLLDASGNVHRERGPRERTSISRAEL